MNKILLEPDTTLYPVPVVLVTCAFGETINVFSLNRIASCNAEPPMIAISVRPIRASHDLIAESGEFVVNIPWPDMEVVSDFVGTTTIRKTDKWTETGLIPIAARHVQAPLLAECPVNLECVIRQQLRLPSHTLFVAEVVALHAESAVLNQRGEVDFGLAQGGMAYQSGPVRERPVDNFRPADLHRRMQGWAISRRQNR